MTQVRLLSTAVFSVVLLSGCRADVAHDQATKLGQREFTPPSWAEASEIERGEMTASFLRQYDATSLNRTQIEQLLGAPTGYYYYDNNPAYFVGPNTVTSIHGDGYLWVFEADKDDGQIERVFFVPEVK